jgi:hypothetical protein
VTTLVCSTCGEVYKTRRWKPEMDEARCACGGSRVSPGQAARRNDPCASETGRKKSARKLRPAKKRSEPKRDWTLALAKKEEEGDICRVCGASGTECAHILGRKFDQPISPGSRTLLVLPDRIVPLCASRHLEDGTAWEGCHARYDDHQLDLLPFLTASEQAQAVLDAGSMGQALKRICPMLEMAA